MDDIQLDDKMFTKGSGLVLNRHEGKQRRSVTRRKRDAAHKRCPGEKSFKDD